MSKILRQGSPDFYRETLISTLAEYEFDRIKLNSSNLKMYGTTCNMVIRLIISNAGRRISAIVLCTYRLAATTSRNGGVGSGRYFLFSSINKLCVYI